MKKESNKIIVRIVLAHFIVLNICLVAVTIFLVWLLS